MLKVTVYLLLPVLALIWATLFFFLGLFESGWNLVPLVGMLAIWVGIYRFGRFCYQRRKHFNTLANICINVCTMVLIAEEKGQKDEFVARMSMEPRDFEKMIRGSGAV